jgi:hypothetical protein
MTYKYDLFNNIASINVKTMNRNKAIIITLDDEYVRNLLQLNIARTIIHENVHVF